MLGLILFFAAMTANGGGGPVDETCNFLPADDPCHFPADPPPPLCEGGNGRTICEGP